MKIFVWQNADNLTNQCHSGGGLLVVAADLNRAKEMIKLECPETSALQDPPHFEWQTVNAAESLIIFPDAGCC